jgi:hypothetical protein
MGIFAEKRVTAELAWDFDQPDPIRGARSIDASGSHVG